MNITFDPIIERLKKLDPKYHYVILGGALLFVFLLNYFLLFRPLLGSLNKVNTQISELRSNLQDAKTDMARVGQNRDQLEKIRGQVNQVKVKIRSAQEVPLILEDISRIASAQGLKIDQLMPLKDQKVLLAKQKDVEYYALPILVQARSPYHDLGRWLAQLEEEKIFYGIGSLSITANPKDTMRHQIQVTIKAAIFEPTKELAKDDAKGKK
jgi:Tfp pilus assembly protein PilO